MASFIDDLTNMKVDGASSVHGLQLLHQEYRNEHPYLSILMPLGLQYLPSAARSYAMRWNSVTRSDKRDIIAALRTSGRVALIAAKIAKLFL